MEEKKALITGGCGFIGSHLVDFLLSKNYSVVNCDKLTYAANKNKNIIEKTNSSYKLVEIDITESNSVEQLIEKHKFDFVFNLAAETHVDNSISDPNQFLQTNVIGTYNLLKICQKFISNNVLSKDFRYLQISTDEVYGTLKLGDPAFTEKSQIQPNSPYSATKASADLLVRAWVKTYKFPAIITRCSNNYGPRQNEEKLIPKVINCCLTNKPIPVYGDGLQIRDWIYVLDHVKGIMCAAEKGKIGEVYNFGGDLELTNIELIKKIIQTFSILTGKPSEELELLIQYVEDRLGHDTRYAVNSELATTTLRWSAETLFETGIINTIKSYLP